jgi:hypothetical protein
VDKLSSLLSLNLDVLLILLIHPAFPATFIEA